MDTQFVLIVGTPVTGFVMTGPFPSRNAAAQYAAIHLDFAQAMSNHWWVAPMFKPVQQE